MHAIAALPERLARLRMQGAWTTLTSRGLLQSQPGDDGWTSCPRGGCLSEVLGPSILRCAGSPLRELRHRRFARRDFPRNLEALEQCSILDPAEFIQLLRCTVKKRAFVGDGFSLALEAPSECRLLSLEPVELALRVQDDER